jgi:SDR family mycofactocin-dependent oxidoreductase
MAAAESKVAFITGGARGQGRSHALTLARAGYDIVALDLAAELQTTAYPASTLDDLADTEKAVEQIGRRCLTIQADVRDRSQMAAAVQEALSLFGRIDVVAANAGILGPALPVWELTDEDWEETLSINLHGVWQTVKAVAPPMVEARRGAIVLTSSTMGKTATANMASYVTAKHGVLGLMRAAAVDLAPHGVRVNAVCPTTVNTDMILPSIPYFANYKEDATLEDAAEGLDAFTLMPGVPWVEPQDISNAVAFLVSDEARYVTGTALAIDAGTLIMPPGFGVHTVELAEAIEGAPTP